MNTPMCAAFDAMAARKRSKADWMRALQRTDNLLPSSTDTICALVDRQAAKSPDGLALIGETTQLTYGALVAFSNRVARWAHAQGFDRGDRVALFMGNSPFYPALWIGLARIGVVTALLNDRLVGDSLAAAIATADAKAILCCADTALAARAVAPSARILTLEASMEGVEGLDEALAPFSGAPLADCERVAITLSDPALLIYTSGTTGLPKAAHVNHFRISMWAEWFAAIIDARTDDRLYDCLPLSHSVGGVVAIGAMLVSGGAVVVRRGFSARAFWDDVRASGATVFQYIGELPRYLLASATSEKSPVHNLRLCIGNGLRGEIWTEFQSTFAIPRIIEFYAATEGVFSLFNLEGKPGAIGRIPPYLVQRTQVMLAKVDLATGTLLRGSDGLAVACGTDEPGEALGRLSPRDAMKFEGYTNVAASEAKILRDVFVAGDAWFRTGDLMRRDAAGYFAFVDRIGDTFRWKGENVSTSEVAAILSRVRGVCDVAVYGVEVPGADGRAGMAAVTPGDDFDRDKLLHYAKLHLPSFAVPLFLRICAAIAATGTFRAKKSDLLREGFDPRHIEDPIYMLDLDRSTYVRLDAVQYESMARAGTATYSAPRFA